MSSEHQDELNWMAFSYIAGELPAEAASAFERRLADDQPARDAVCEAIALAERLLVAAPSANDLVRPVSATGTAFKHDTSSIRSRAVHALGWMIAGAVAATLFFWLVRPLGTMPIGPANPSLRGTEVARQHPAESLADPVAWPGCAQVANGRQTQNAGWWMPKPRPQHRSSTCRTRPTRLPGSSPRRRVPKKETSHESN